ASNPFFAARENTNEDSRTHHTFGASATWSTSSWLSIAGRVSHDAWTADRDFSIARGWIGGFPTNGQRADFGEGGFQSQTVGARTNSGELTATTSPFRRGSLSGSFVAGARRMAHHAERSTVVYDTSVVGTDTTSQRLALTPTEENFWN